MKLVNPNDLESPRNMALYVEVYLNDEELKRFGVPSASDEYMEEITSYICNQYNSTMSMREASKN